MGAGWGQCDLRICGGGGGGRRAEEFFRAIEIILEGAEIFLPPDVADDLWAFEFKISEKINYPRTAYHSD